MQLVELLKGERTFDEKGCFCKKSLISSKRFWMWMVKEGNRNSSLKEENEG